MLLKGLWWNTVIYFHAQISHIWSVEASLKLFLHPSGRAASFSECRLAPCPSCCPKLILFYPCHSSGGSLFFQKPWLIFMENGIHKPKSAYPVCSFQMVHHYSWAGQWREVGNRICLCICTHTLVAISVPVYLQLFWKIIISNYDLQV